MSDYPTALCPKCGGKWAEKSERPDELAGLMSEMGDVRNRAWACENGHVFYGWSADVPPEES